MKRVLIILFLSVIVKLNYAQLAIDFAGTGNYASTNYSLSVFAFTVQYDMYIYNHFNYNGGISFNCTGGTPSPIDFYVNNMGQPISTVGNCSPFHSLAYPALTTGTWHNIAYTYSYSLTDAKIKVYIDGVLVGMHSTFGVGPVTNVFRIGDRLDGVTNAEAKFDNVKIWSVERTPTQILADMNTCFTGTEPNLDILYKMEEGSGTVINDLALANGAQNATITGAVTWTSGVPDGVKNTTIDKISCTNYTSPSGNYVWNTSGVYRDTLSSVIAGCDSIITVNLTINDFVNSDVELGTNSFCDSGSTNVNIANSELGVNYWLRDDADNSIVSGPVAGNGSGLSMSTGTVSNTTTFNVYAEKNIDYGVRFNSSNLDKVIFDQPYGTFSNEISIEAWVYFDSTVTPSIPFMGQASYGVDNMASNVWLWAPQGFANNIIFYVNDGGTWRSLPTVALDNSVRGWHHLATVANSAGISIYLDGASIAFSSLEVISNVTDNVSSTLSVGGDPRYPLAAPSHGNYAISDLRIWNTTRSSTDIINNMNACLSGTEAGLVFYNKFDNGSGRAATSIVGSRGMLSSGMNPVTAWIEGTDTCNICNFTMTESLTLTINTVNTNVTNTSPTLTAVASGATYQWLDCDNSNTPISGATNQSFTAATNGNYAVIITQNGCTDTSACQLVNNIGIEEVSFGSEFILSPNPTNGNFIIDLGDVYEDVSISIKNELGQILKKQYLGDTNTIHSFIEDTSGIYFVEITSSNNRSKNIKVVITK